jgi:hypothetical protein
MGDEQKAVDYYRQASASQSEVGKQAAVKLARLDLPKHPHNYLAIETMLNARGTVSLQIVNQAAIAVHNMQLEVRLLADYGKVLAAHTLPIRGTLQPGKSMTVDSGLKPSSKTYVQARIIRVQVAP